MPRKHAADMEKIWKDIMKLNQLLPPYDDLIETRNSMLDKNGNGELPSLQDVLQETLRVQGKDQMIELQDFSLEKIEEKIRPELKEENLTLGQLWENSYSKTALYNMNVYTLDQAAMTYSSLREDKEFAKAYPDSDAYMNIYQGMTMSRYSTERLAKSEQFLKNSTEYIADYLYNGGTDLAKAKAVLKNSTYRLDQDLIGVDDEMWLEEDGIDTKMIHPYTDHEIDRYMETIRSFGKGGAIEQAVKKAGKTGKDTEPIFSILKSLKESFENRSRQKVSKTGTTSTLLPQLDEKIVSNLQKQCDEYMKKHGYEDTDENRMVRQISNAAAKTSIEHDMSSEDLTLRSQDAVMARLKLLRESLAKQSGSVFRNSDEFEAMKKSLDNICKKDVIDMDDLKDLQDKSAYYMDKKGSSKRGTSKGQNRFDIAKDLFDLTKAASLKETTKEDLERTANEVYPKKTKVSFEDLARDEKERQRAQEHERKNGELLREYYQEKIKIDLNLKSQEKKAPEMKAPQKKGK